MISKKTDKLERGAGILLAISSLPSPYGIGTLGRSAYEFVDQLRDAGQSYWQVLPIGPVSLGDSPYQTFCTFAGNPYYIDLDFLKEEGLLTQEEIDQYDWQDTADRVSYEKLWAYRYEILRTAFARSDFKNADDYKTFEKENKDWLPDFALFMACKNHFDHKEWLQWDKDIRDRKREAVKKYTEELAEDIDFWKFLQFEFYTQWTALHQYAKNHGIEIIGDIPLYTALDSADVWTNRSQYQLEKDGYPRVVAGCPPDAFSSDGQKWGNPIYDWDKMEADGFKWWKRRVEKAAELFDVIRIDHFIGLVRYYAIPYTGTGRDGKFHEGPCRKLTSAIDEARGNCKIIAEDLGIKTRRVDEVMHAAGYPGMKIFEFAFDGNPDNEHLPHNYTEDYVVYGGTHDNETLVGYYDGLSKRSLQYALDYCDAPCKKKLIDAVYKMAYRSIARVVVFQMQDVLKKGNETRMNLPATIGNNWRWRLMEGEFDEKVRNRFDRLATTFGRKKKSQNVFAAFLEERFQKKIADCNDAELYAALLTFVKEEAKLHEKPQKLETGKRKLYYISAEFLLGKLLGNNLINLGLYDEIRRELEEEGRSLAKLEELEAEPSLGNGGLGRLAACFLDSIASLGLPGDGVGLNYHLGLFKQEFKDGLQKEVVNPWIDEKCFLEKQNKSYTVEFGDFKVKSTLYDIAVTGYENRTNHLHLFDLDTVDDSLVKDGIDFDKTKIKKNLTLFLYPDDSDEAGNLLRVYQQYFMVSNAAQMILDEALERGSNLHDLDQYVAIQINDTHPSMVIPEMIRLLVARKISMEEASAIVSRMCAYTNHTILAEALEKWPIRFLEKVAPQIVPIIRFLDEKIKNRYADPSVAIIDDQDRVHMAHMDIHYGYSVNGVAYLHTEILKNSELRNFYQLYPEKFNNKTNGITFRRWLLHCNRPLTGYIEEKIGPYFRKDATKLEKLLRYKDDMETLNQLLLIKQENKDALASYLEETSGTLLNTNSIFDIQVKRLHEYKRQQLNCLYAIHKYLEIKKGHKPNTPITMIFGAKAAPAYTIAKDIIHLILCLQKLTETDPDVSPYLHVVMLENYNVTFAEKVIPACDISEQISLASKEASGTGNMKFMLNGAVTLGTMDGANVEIRDLVGDDNIYIFGEDAQTVIDRYERGDYCAKDYVEKDPQLKKAVEFIVGKEMMALGQKENLERLYHELMNKDWFMTFPDFKDYVKTKERIYKDYDNRFLFARKMLVNIAKAGFFSSDRTIAEYNRDIWKLK